MTADLAIFDRAAERFGSAREAVLRRNAPPTLSPYQQGARAALSLRAPALLTIYDLLLTTPGLNVRQITRSLKASLTETTVSRRLNELEDAGLIRTEPGPNGSRRCYPLEAK